MTSSTKLNKLPNYNPEFEEYCRVVPIESVNHLEEVFLRTDCSTKGWALPLTITQKDPFSRIQVEILSGNP